MKSEILWPEGIRKTKSRKIVLDLLEKSETPMTAMDILAAAKQTNEPVWISTIYRILDIFVEKEVIIKTEVIEKGIAIYELNRNEHKHYAVCIACHKVTPIKNCPIHTFEPELKDVNFYTLGHKLEIYGYCELCYSKTVTTG